MSSRRLKDRITLVTDVDTALKILDDIDRRIAELIRQRETVKVDICNLKKGFKTIRRAYPKTWRWKRK